MTIALEPTWTTTSFFPKTTPLPHLGHHKHNKMMLDQFVTTTTSRATTLRRLATPSQAKRVAEPLLTVREAQWGQKRVGHIVAAAVAAVDVVTTATATWLKAGNVTSAVRRAETASSVAMGSNVDMDSAVMVRNVDTAVNSAVTAHAASANNVAMTLVANLASAERVDFALATTRFLPMNRPSITMASLNYIPKDTASFAMQRKVTARKIPILSFPVR
jgi:hypothetical protein